MPEHIDDPISSWEQSMERPVQAPMGEPWYEETLPGQIPDPRQPDLTAPIHEEEEVGFEIVSEPLHDEGSYGEHHGFPR